MKIYTSYSEGRLTLYFQGELDHHESKKAVVEAEEAILSYLPRDCVIDMSSLSFMDSSGIAVILRIYKRMSTNGGRTRIENAAGQPLRVLDTSGIDRIIKVFSVKEHV